MQTNLSPEFKNSAHGKQAESILRSCVHCGFCNATCPTYQLLGDELDGPRGRIYLIKDMLEGGEVGRRTQVHLDRCLTCLNCETTCPSGVEYGKLVTIGRALVDERVARPWGDRLRRWVLKAGLLSALFAPALKMARLARGVLPAELKKFIPAGSPAVRPWPTTKHSRQVILLAGCVQPAMLPNINIATARVLDAAGIETIVAVGAGCCGALREHLGDTAGALANARRNIDAWWPAVEAGSVEAIVSNASACGLAVKHYGEALRGDTEYADRAARIAAMTCDVAELVRDLVPALKSRMRPQAQTRVTFHTPCTLQHGQGLKGLVEAQLGLLGLHVQTSSQESHLCCGSAGTYSVLQPALARQLRDRKLSALAMTQPQCIVSANVGCIAHLQSGTAIPVRHWIEVLEEALDVRG